jgi:hypothetical protein
VVLGRRVPKPLVLGCCPRISVEPRSPDWSVSQNRLLAVQQLLLVVQQAAMVFCWLIVQQGLLVVQQPVAARAMRSMGIQSPPNTAVTS